MASTVSPAVIKKTQQSLGKFVSKPQLTDKLLSKPPFRFLHDIVSAVIRDHHVLVGLLDENELKSDSVADKDAKVRYLDKVIACVAIASGVNLTAKPGKIVSGQEPEKTNEVLQALAKIINDKIDTSDAVARARNGEKPSGKAAAAPAKGKENVANGAARANRPSAANRDRPRRPSVTSRESEPAEAEVIEPEAAPVLETLKEEEPPVNGEDHHENGDAHVEPELEATPVTNGHNGVNGHAVSPPIDSAINGGLGGISNGPLSTMQAVEVADAALPDPPPAATPARPQSAMRPRTSRPPSARRGAPKLKEKRQIQDQIQDRPTTSRVVNVILSRGEGGSGAAAADGADIGDGEEFLIEEKPKNDLDIMTELNATALPQNLSNLENGGQDAGALVQQILETQKELEEVSKAPGDDVSDPGRDVTVARRGDTEAANKQVERLRESIQTLARSANPLAKLMDFLQEDVDAMQRELDTWKKENQRLQQDLRQEQMTTDRSVEPLKVQLADLDAAVQQQLDQIAAVKSNIMRNEEKISKMIASIGTYQGAK